jgi:uracil-DNA glycosylase
MSITVRSQLQIFAIITQIAFRGESSGRLSVGTCAPPGGNRACHGEALDTNGRDINGCDAAPPLGSNPLTTGLPTELPEPINSLRALARAEASCTRCPLYRNATQAVPGEGPRRAAIMLVGEQPGDKEDIAGKPFVGPAGRVLDRALRDAGIAREETFVTGAVKHFKHEMRGKRRLHKRPDNYEIERCRIWLDVERRLVRPSTIVALGVTAARSLTGRTLTIGKVRGKPIELADGTRLIVTVHPAALLRTEDEAERRKAYRSFVADLRTAATTHSGATPRKRAS